MDVLLGDAKLAFRTLAGNRGFATAILITISLAVGGTAAIFSLVYGVLLRPLPYPHPDRLVRLWEMHPGANAPFSGALLSNLTYDAWSGSSDSLEDIGAFVVGDFTVTGLGAAERLRGVEVTPEVFRLLRVRPAAGRVFIDADAEINATPVVVLGHGTWRERFGGDPTSIGKTLTINGMVHAIVGVAPSDFSFPGPEGSWSDGTQEIALYTALSIPVVDPGAVSVFGAVARLKPGATIAQAEAEGTARARSRYRPVAADLFFGKGGSVEVRVRTMADEMTRRVRPFLGVLAAAIALVLLIASANAGNLFLSRNADRAHELAVRAAMGAGRGRLLRALLTESLAISLLGCILGMLVGWALIAAGRPMMSTAFPRIESIRVDLGFVGVAAVAAVFVGTVSSIVPALRISGDRLAASTRAHGIRSVGITGRKLRSALLVGEAALAVVLLVGAALLARSFVELVNVETGYEAKNVLTADLHLPGGPDMSERTSRLALSTLEHLRALPEVHAAGAGSIAPFGGALSSASFSLPGVTTREGTPVVARALHTVITPGYAEALGMRLTEGRLIRTEDTESTTVAMLVNQTFARTYFSDGRPAAGRRFSGMFPRMLGRDDVVVEVVGVVEDVLNGSLDGPRQPQVYVSLGRGFKLSHATFVMKSEADPTSLAPGLRKIVQQLEPSAALDRVGPLTDKVSASVGKPRFTALVLGGFAALALSLATTGLYGFLSYDVARRRREIGVRAALGASPGDIVSMVLCEGVAVTAVGLVIGGIGAAFATRAMGSTLFGVTPLDGVSFSVGPGILLVVAAGACLMSARRAAKVDPAAAVRAD